MYIIINKEKLMINFRLVLISYFIFMCLLFLGCASTVDGSYVRGQAVDINESIIVVKRPLRYTGAALAFKIYIDGKQIGKVMTGGEIAFTVPNGTHTIHVEAVGAFSSNKINFTANSQEITFRARPSFLTTKIVKIDEIALIHTNTLFSSDPNVTDEINERIGNNTLDRAIFLASNEILSKFSSGQKISILNISSNDLELSEYAIEELTVLLVNSGKLVVLERKDMDVINAEHKFQLSGEVHDDEIISIGNKFGAQAIITCSINGIGNLRRLRIKALDVLTGQILSYTSYSI